MYIIVFVAVVVICEIVFHFSLFRVIFIYILKGWGSRSSIVGETGARARVILVLRECIWNAPTVSLVLSTFDHTGSLGSLPR